MKSAYYQAFRLVCVAFLLASVSCDNEDDAAATSGVEANVCSDISTMTGSTDNQWHANDAIGVYMVKAGKGIVVNTASNQKFVTSGDRNFAPAQGKILFPTSGEKVDFLAYYPYKDLTYDFLYPIDLKDQSAGALSPFMYADRVQNKEAGAPQVDFLFKHQLAKMVLNVKAGEGIPSIAELAIKIKGLKADAVFDLLEGSIRIDPQAEEIRPTKLSADSFCALLLPSEELGDEHTIDFVTPGNTYTWKMSENITKIEQSKIYEFNISIDRTGITISGTIKDWEDTDWQNGSAGNN